MNRTEFDDLHDAFSKWQKKKFTVGGSYLPIFRAIAQHNSRDCCLHAEGIEARAFLGLDPKVWIIKTQDRGSVDGSNEELPDTAYDVYFKRFVKPASVGAIFTSAREIGTHLSSSGVAILEEKIDLDSFDRSVNDALLRWIYVCEALSLKILFRSVVWRASSAIELSTKMDAFFSLIVCRVSETHAIGKIISAISEVEADVGTHKNLAKSAGSSLEHAPTLDKGKLEKLEELELILRGQSTAAEIMLTSLTDSADAMKDASRRLLKLERRVLALRKQTSLLLPFTYPWSAFASAVLRIVTKFKDKRKKKRIAEVLISSSASVNSVSGTDVVIESSVSQNTKDFSPNPSILLLKLDHIGDFFLALPAIELLKQAWPDARLTIVCSPTNGGLARSSGYFDEVIEYKFSAEMSQDVKKARLETYSNIAKAVPQTFDLAIDLRHDPDTRPLLMFVRSKIKAGFEGDRGHYSPLDISLPLMETARGLYNNSHNVHRLMLLCSHVVNVLKGTDAKVAFTSLVKNSSYVSPLEGQSYMILAPGGGTQAKKWEPAKFADLAARIRSETDCKVALIGGNAELPYRDALIDKISDGTVVDLIGKLPLVDLAEVTSKAEVFIGTDTGATHLAAMLDVPTVAIFSGVADPNVWKPMGPSVTVVRRPLACSPCHIARIEDCVGFHKCMVDITVDDVLSVVLSSLNKRRTSKILIANSVSDSK